jgi:hypothetical protein
LLRDTPAEVKRLELKVSFRVEEKVIPTSDEIYAHLGEGQKLTPKMHGMGQSTRTKNLNFHEKECISIPKTTTSEITQDSPLAIRQSSPALF